MTRDWLTKRVTVAEAEAAHTHEGVPFGFSNRAWVAIKQTMLPGDEIWEFSSPDESWAQRCGRGGRRAGAGRGRDLHPRHPHELTSAVPAVVLTRGAAGRVRPVCRPACGPAVPHP